MRLSDGEKALFGAAIEQPNLFLDWYFRTPGTGTWITPVEYKPADEYPATDPSRPSYSAELNEIIRSRRQEYLDLSARWVKLGKAATFDEYRVVIGKGAELPSFFRNHGFQFVGWQESAFHASQDNIIVRGGFGSMKTSYATMDAALRCAVLPNFRAFFLAPYRLQVQEMFKKLKAFFRGTRYEKQFVANIVNAPYPTIVIRNEICGESSIECYSIGDDVEKLKTLEGDMIVIDQAEELSGFDNIMEITSSRMRGIDMSSGREKLGRFIWLANPAMNYELNDLFDRHQKYPEAYLSIQPSTYENPSISIKQFIRFERDVAGSEEKRAVNLKGFVPMGSGMYFPTKTLDQMRSYTLDELMQTARNTPAAVYEHEERPGIGVTTWALPPEPGHTYMVVADPGYDNPPQRNSPAIGVWDVTYCERGLPMTLRAFYWVYGNHSPEPWLMAFKRAVKQYKAENYCGFDANGWQEGAYMQEFNVERDGISPIPIKLSEANKMSHINKATTLSAKGLIKLPFIQGAFNQLSAYELPDKQLRQDIVMMICMSAYLAFPLFPLTDPDDGRESHITEYRDRHYRPQTDRKNRYGKRSHRVR